MLLFHALLLTAFCCWFPRCCWPRFAAGSRVVVGCVLLLVPAFPLVAFYCWSPRCCWLRFTASFYVDDGCFLLLVPTLLLTALCCWFLRCCWLRFVAGFYVGAGGVLLLRFAAGLLVYRCRFLVVMFSVAVFVRVNGPRDMIREKDLACFFCFLGLKVCVVSQTYIPGRVVLEHMTVQ